MNHEHWGTGNQIHSIKLTSLCQLCAAWWNPLVGPLGVTVTQVKNSCVVLKIMMNIYFKNKIHIMTGAQQKQGYRWICIWELLCDINREEDFNVFHKGFVVYLLWSLGLENTQSRNHFPLKQIKTITKSSEKSYTQTINGMRLCFTKI